VEPSSQTATPQGNPEDPDADPNTPGLAEIDDPGRETMMARQRDAVYEIIPEEQEAEFEDEEAVPEEAAPEQAQQPVEQPVQPAPQPPQP
jgi:hypothetical protein